MATPSIGNMLKITGGIARQRSALGPGLLKVLNISGLASIGVPFASEGVAGASRLATRSGFDAELGRVLNSPSPLAEAIRAERLTKLMQMNEAMIMQTQPHLYAELLVGRRLVPGDRVYGATPRRDLIEEAAYGMATGQFPTGE